MEQEVPPLRPKGPVSATKPLPGLFSNGLSTGSITELFGVVGGVAFQSGGGEGVVLG